MPKLNWPQNGRGSKSVTLSPSCELKQIGGAWVVCPSAKFISGCKEQGRSEVTRQVAEGVLIPPHFKYVVEEFSKECRPDYLVSRPSQNPPVLPPPDPVERVSSRIGTWMGAYPERAFYVGVVALILIVLVAIVIRGVAW